MSKINSQDPSTSSPPPLPLALEDSDSRLAENQLLAELAQAAESPMVSTRSHDRYLENVDISTQVKRDTFITASKKRKFEKGTATVDMNGQSPLPRRKARKSKPAGEAHSEEQENEGDPVTGIPKGGDGSLTKHKRFGSEEVEIDTTLESLEPVATAEKEKSQDEEDSDNDAPEAITVAAGYEASRAAAVDATKIAEQQQNVLRAKRRDLDSRLKAQAEAFKSRRQPKVSKKTNTALPDLLPDELLATEPVVRPPTPPSSSGKLVVSKKMKVLDSGPKPPKDVRRGSKIFRVLPVETSVLPPRSSAASKAIRENWLMGQRGSLGGVGVSRRKMGIGFLRK